MTAEAEKRRVSAQQLELHIRAVRSLYEISHNSLRGTNSLFRTPGASEQLLSMSSTPVPCHQLLCLVTSSSAMSSARPHHLLPRHPPACAAQGSSSGCPTQCMQTGMAAGIHGLLPREQ